jgi:RNA polymerase sigma factor (sigma-70 family)
LNAGPHAAAALYEQHSSRVFGYCLSRLGGREDAEDAVQTTFLHAVRGLRRGVVPATEVAWLLGIARNVCLARWESVGRRSRLEIPCDPVDLERGNAAPQGRREELIGLEDALSQLPEQQRRAVLLRDWRGLSYDEIAMQLGVSHAAVETLIFRGRRTLAELLREEPQATRRRLRSLGELGSFFSAVKTAFTGGVAATKVATAVVTAVALSGAGVAVGTSSDGGGGLPVQAPETKRVHAASLFSAATDANPKPSSPAAPESLPPTRRTPAPVSPAPLVASDGIAAAPATAVNAPVAPTSSEPAPQTPSSSSPPTAPHGVPQPHPSPPAPVAVAPPAAELLPVASAPLEQTVDALLPNVPVEVPSLPLPPITVPPTAVQIPDVPALVTDTLATVPLVTVPTVEVSLPPLLP